MKIHGIEIKDGYLLVVKTNGAIHNMTVSSIQGGALGCLTKEPEHYWTVDRFNEDGVFIDSEVIAIYGRTHPKFLLDNSTDHRERLWARERMLKKMTVAEICAALGYDVEIVKEGQK